MQNHHYNIMTSCDVGILPYVCVLLNSISVNLKEDYIDFYLLHRGIDEKSLEVIYAYCNALGNVQLFDFIVPDAEIFDDFAKSGGGWSGEAYFSLCAHILLPMSVDRVLYLDAGDTLVTGDIWPYYSSDFEDKALIVTAARLKSTGNSSTIYCQKDIQDVSNGLPGIARGLFNSGSYVINLNKLREFGITINDYQVLVDTLRRIFGKENSHIYWGDQGLLSLTFVEDIKYYDYPSKSSIYYMPYNFCMWYYDRLNVKPDYVPKVIHFAGGFKPWVMSYPIEIKRYAKDDIEHEMSELKIGQAEYYYQWHEYAIISDTVLKSIGL